MRSIIFAWLVMALAQTSFADPVRSKIVFSNDQVVQFVPIPGRNGLISAGCQVRGEWRCKAHEAMERASLKGLEYMQRNSAINLGASICVSKLAGTLVVGRDTAEKDRSFCRFSDGSLVENSALLKSAERADGSGNDLEKAGGAT